MDFDKILPHYTTGNIMGSRPSPVHSGPELCSSVPEPKPATKLAQEVMMGRLELVQSHTSLSGGGGIQYGLRLDPK